MKGIDDYPSRLVSMTMLPLALFLWTVSIFESIRKLQNPLNLGDLGLIEILSPLYFAAIGIITLSFFLVVTTQKRSQKTLFLHVLLLVLFLFSTPTLVEGYRARNSYSAYGFVDYIVTNGQIDPEKVWYHNWPAFNILYAILVEVTSISPEFLIRAFPTLPQILYFLPVYMFARNITKDVKKTWISVWAFYLITWVGQDFLSPQSLAIFVYGLMLYLLYNQILEGNVRLKGRSKQLVSIAFFIVLTTGHFLTSLAVFFILFLFYIFKYRRISNTVTFFSLILTSWTIYGAASYFESNLLGFVDEAFRFDLVLKANVVARISGSSGHALVSEVRMVSTALMILFAISGFLISFKTKRNYSMNKKVAVGLGALAIFALFFPYGGELFMRIYLFGAIMVICLISMNMDSKKTSVFLLLFLMLVPPLHVISHYGNEKHDFIPLSEMCGSNFFYEKTFNCSVLGGAPWGSFIGAYDKYQTVQLGSTNLSKYEEDILRPSFKTDQPLFLIITWGDRAFFSMFYNSTDFWSNLEAKMADRPSHNKIYSAPWFELYGIYHED